MNIEDVFNEEYIRNEYPEHGVVQDGHGRLRWVANETVEWSFDIGILDLNKLQAHKKDERYRKLYRDLGYSLFGYWEVFYWSVNQ